jgi:hypothetical protein
MITLPDYLEERRQRIIRRRRVKTITAAVLLVGLAVIALVRMR